MQIATFSNPFLAGAAADRAISPSRWNDKKGLVLFKLGKMHFIMAPELNYR